ncbi:MAG: hypothetical protein GY791_21340 [Alphaproteobacteria bacterium]|nr:hypothetical protein [Alphaproteobacteria bacterium]
MRALILVLVAISMTAALLSACDKKQNPFWVLRPEPEKDAAMLYLPDRAGIVVGRVEGIDSSQSAALTEALVAALQAANVPAGSGEGAGNQDSQILETRGHATAADADGVDVEITWDLYEHGGTLIGSGVAAGVVPPGSWATAEPSAMNGLANRIVPEVAGLIQVDMGEQALLGERTKVHFAGLTNAPGDGAKVLPPLVTYLFTKNGYEVTKTTEGGFTVTGHYIAAPEPENMERIALNWQVVDPGGQEIGVITQENVIPKGTLDGAWGDAAFFIAEGAVQGVHALLLANADAADGAAE